MTDVSGPDLVVACMSAGIIGSFPTTNARDGVQLREWFAHNYGNADMAERMSVWGSEARVAADLDRLIEAGANHLLLNPVFDYHEHIDALRPYAGTPAG